MKCFGPLVLCTIHRRLRDVSIDGGCGCACVLLCGDGIWQADSSLEGYFTGKQVVVKIDMPGSQKGIDLKFNKPSPMDWNDYSSRLKSDGISIHKGDVARVTKFVAKSDMIEFQLNGGGFGTAGDDTNTVVATTAVPKSQYEKDLEKQIATATDAKKKQELQNDLNKERSRRGRTDAQNQNDAKIASQMKAQQVADERLQGGSRFNLRWQGSIPSDSRNPDAVMKLLADYVDFNVANTGAPVVNSFAVAGPAPSGGAASQLKRGMSVDEVSNLLGQGKVLSESVSNDGLKTQVLEYRTADNVADVTYVEGVLVKYTISSK
jgi:hypothetical protein